MRWMGPLAVKLITVLVLSVQVLAGISPGRSVWCLGFGADACGAAPAPAPVAERGCCAGCKAAESPLPTPVQDDEKCPPGCGCCFEIAVPVLPTLVDSSQGARDLQQALLHSWTGVLVQVCIVDAPQAPCGYRGGPPPDRPSMHSSLGLRAIRLLV